MKNALALFVTLTCSLASVAHAADAGCQALPDDETAAGDILVGLRAQVAQGEVLRVDFEEAEFCVIDRTESGIDGRSGAVMQVNENLDEIAVQARLDGTELWLRVNNSYSEAMILSRAVSESLGLTDAEFLGDNSLLEASDFFVEFLDSLEIGDVEVSDVEVNIPRLDVPYDHYAGRESAEPGERITEGSIGEVILEELILIFDFANNRVYVADAS